jgi:MoaA/NifB/PqqE/SkfB family radical SAM enzyme
MGLGLNKYYALYDWLGSSRNRYFAIRLARAAGFRYLLVRFDTNFLCNLKCQTCYFSGPQIKSMMRSPMTEEQFTAVAKAVFPKARILFLSCGGEPLMTKNFGRFLDITSTYKVPYVGFITNALLFKQDTVDAVMRNRVNEIIISVDGATAPTYEYIRQGGKFDVLLEKLQMLVDAKKRDASKLPDLRFNFTVTRSNFREMVDLVELARRFGVSTIKFRHFTDWGGKFKFRDESLQGHEEEFNGLLARARSKAAEYGMTVYSPEPFGLVGGTKPKVPTVEEIIDASPRPPCIMPWYHLYIDAEGLSRPCAYLPLRNESLFTHTLAQVENAPESAARRKALLEAPRNSCLAGVCMGQILRRANEDSDNLAQYDDEGLVDKSLRLHTIDTSTPAAESGPTGS